MSCRANRLHGGVAVIVAVLALARAAAQPPADVPPVAPDARGELLYATHCVGCHDEQIHWRERKSARDWATLREQVDRWQQAGHLDWSPDDVDAVTHHLNDTIYRFAAPHTHAGRPGASRPEPAALMRAGGHRAPE